MECFFKASANCVNCAVLEEPGDKSYCGLWQVMPLIALMPAVGNFKLIQPRGGPGIFTLTVPVNGHYVIGEDSDLTRTRHGELIPDAASSAYPH